MKNILITGSSRGLGLEFTKQFLEKGENVIASCRNPNNATELHELKNKYPNNISIIQLDVTDEEGRNRVYKQVKNELNSLDILINNAGIIAGNEEGSSPFGEIYKEDFSKVFLVNSISPLLMSERFLSLLENGENAKIVNMSSLNGSIANRNVGGKYSYAASKAALNMITKILSNDLRSKGIIAIALHPGWIETDMGGPNAPLQKEEPISMIIELIEKCDISSSGKFLDWKGKEVPW